MDVTCWAKCVGELKSKKSNLKRDTKLLHTHYAGVLGAIDIIILLIFNTITCYF